MKKMSEVKKKRMRLPLILVGLSVFLVSCSGSEEGALGESNGQPTIDTLQISDDLGALETITSATNLIEEAVIEEGSVEERQIFSRFEYASKDEEKLFENFSSVSSTSMTTVPEPSTSVPSSVVPIPSGGDPYVQSIEASFIGRQVDIETSARCNSPVLMVASLRTPTAAMNDTVRRVQKDSAECNNGVAEWKVSLAGQTDSGPYVVEIFARHVNTPKAEGVGAKTYVLRKGESASCDPTPGKNC